MGKNGDVGGGWKGEERPARSFVFVRKGEAAVPGDAGGNLKGVESSDEEDRFDTDSDEHNSEGDDNDAD